MRPALAIVGRERVKAQGIRSPSSSSAAFQDIHAKSHTDPDQTDDLKFDFTGKLSSRLGCPTNARHSSVICRDGPYSFAATGY